MLRITIPGAELWDAKRLQFVNTEPQVLQLEHSLVSVSKWEAKWNKPFLAKQPKSLDETIDYVRCMTLTQNVRQETYLALTEDNLSAINRYIDAPMTATFFHEENTPKGPREQITSELIYYWMIALGIPFECQKWHLNRLFVLIRVCNVKNQPTKKRSRRDIVSRNAALNASRRKRLNSNG